MCTLPYYCFLSLAFTCTNAIHSNQQCYLLSLKSTSGPHRGAGRSEQMPLLLVRLSKTLDNAKFHSKTCTVHCYLSKLVYLFVHVCYTSILIQNFHSWLVNCLSFRDLVVCMLFLNKPTTDSLPVSLSNFNELVNKQHFYC